MKIISNEGDKIKLKELREPLEWILLLLMLFLIILFIFSALFIPLDVSLYCHKTTGSCEFRKQFFLNDSQRTQIKMSDIIGAKINSDNSRKPGNSYNVNLITKDKSFTVANSDNFQQAEKAILALNDFFSNPNDKIYYLRDGNLTGAFILMVVLLIIPLIYTFKFISRNIHTVIIDKAKNRMQKTSINIFKKDSEEYSIEGVCKVKLVKRNENERKRYTRIELIKLNGESIPLTTLYTAGCKKNKEFIKTELEKFLGV